MRDACSVVQLMDHLAELLLIPASRKVVTLLIQSQGIHAFAYSYTQQPLCLPFPDISRPTGRASFLGVARPTLSHGLCCRGGPSEIIVDGVSGFQIDPFRGEQAADTMADFFEKVCGLPGLSCCGCCSRRSS